MKQNQNVPNTLKITFQYFRFDSFSSQSLSCTVIFEAENDFVDHSSRHVLLSVLIASWLVLTAGTIFLSASGFALFIHVVNLKSNFFLNFSFSSTPNHHWLWFRSIFFSLLLFVHLYLVWDQDVKDFVCCLFETKSLYTVRE